MRDNFEPPTDPSAPWERIPAPPPQPPAMLPPRRSRGSWAFDDSAYGPPTRFDDGAGARAAGLRRLSKLTWRATQLSAVASVGFVALFARTAPAHTAAATVKPTVKPSPSPSPSPTHHKRHHRRHKPAPTLAPPTSAPAPAPPPPPAPSPSPVQSTSGGSGG